MTLRDEILTKCSAEVIASNDVQVICDAFNAGRTILGSVPRAQFAIWAASGPRAVIEDEASNPTSPFRASALTLKDFLVGAADGLELNDPNVFGMLSQWLAAGMITTEQHADLIQRGTHDNHINIQQVADALGI